VSLAITLPSSADAARIEAPPELFERALANLIRNSISHSPSGSEVRVGLELDSESCSVIVRDKGTPFDANNPQRMFEPKGQVSAKTELAGRYSRGLGLLVARIAADGCGAKLMASAATDSFRNAFALRFRRG
jgi:K+-sensing histidine kinase KdpD